MNPILSIVVPTKNRYYYLTFLVRYFHEIINKNIELIIQDNSDIDTNDEFVLCLNKINDLRIKYHYTPKDISVVENCDLAIKNAGGEYILMLGDDDIFSKKIISYIERMPKDIDGLLTQKGIFTWPDVKPRFYGEKLSGKFKFKQFIGIENAVDVDKNFNKILSRGGTLLENMPCVYHGIIKRERLDDIFKITKSYFPGPSPDMANAAALALICKKIIMVDTPFVVAGHSISSAGGKGAQGQHYGSIETIKHLPKDTAKNWSSSVPFYWSGLTIYAESFIKGVSNIGESERLRKLNLNYLYASCLVFDKNYKRSIKETIKKQKISFYDRITIKFYYTKVWLNRINFHIKNNLSLIILPAKHKNNILMVTDTYQLANYLDNIID